LPKGGFCKKKSPFLLPIDFFDKAEMESRTIKNPWG